MSKLHAGDIVRILSGTEGIPQIDNMIGEFKEVRFECGSGLFSVWENTETTDSWYFTGKDLELIHRKDPTQ